MKQSRYAPQALQMLFPTSSRRHSGVVDVPQLAQLSAPTAALAVRLFPLTPGPTPTPLGPGDEAGPAWSVEGRCAEGEEPSISSRVLSALLYVGQPEQADVPPVPSQRPSPGQVPPL